MARRIVNCEEPREEDEYIRIQRRAPFSFMLHILREIMRTFCLIVGQTLVLTRIVQAESGGKRTYYAQDNRLVHYD